jgi:hypothetical protein
MSRSANKLPPIGMNPMILIVVLLLLSPGGPLVLGAGAADVSQGATQSASQESEQETIRRQKLQKLQESYAEEPDLARKIDYLRQMKSLLDPYIDFDKIRTLDNDIRTLEDQLAKQNREQTRQASLARIEAAIRVGHFDVAEQQAAVLTQRFPNDAQAKEILFRVRASRIAEEVKDVLVKPDATCKEFEDADRKINDALKLSPDHVQAKSVKAEVDARIRGCRISFWLRFALIVLCVLAAGAVAYFLLRPRKWVLEVTFGPSKGEIFSLDKPETVIGALGPPNGEADIIISDAERKISRRHCLIVQNGRRLYVVDESANGTKVNDEEIEKENYARLRRGDEITLANEAVLVLRPK